MTYTSNQKDIIRDSFKAIGAVVDSFTNYKYGIKIVVIYPDFKSFWNLDILSGADFIINHLKNDGDIDFIDYKANISKSGEICINIITTKPIPKKIIDRINTEKFKAKPNKFGQIPEVGDYIVGNKSGEISSLFVAEVIGWDSRALIVKNIMGYGQTGEVMTMRWVENMVFPKDVFKEDLDSFLVMMKLSMEH